MTATGKPRRWSRRLIHSFSLKLLLLALILLGLPLILYWQFDRAERAQSALLRNATEQTGRVIAAMLRPHFEDFRNESQTDFNDALAGAAIDNTSVKVLVRLAGAPPDDFIYVASAPPVPADYLKQEQRELVRSGVFQTLAPTCDKTTDLDVRFVNPAGKQEILTSVTPVHVAGNCWIVVTAQNAADLTTVPLNLSFWALPATQAATAIYLLSLGLMIWLLAHMWRNLSRFRSTARDIRIRGPGTTSFGDGNEIPELAGVAEDFDSLVHALTASQAFIKQAAEENAHALKAPLAVIAQSVEPLKRAVAPSDATARRSLSLIERSVARLDTLVSAVRDLEDATADVVYPQQRRIDLSGFLTQMLGDYETALSAKGIRLVASLAGSVSTLASEDVLEPVIENLLENAASFTPIDGMIEASLERDNQWARITVSDHGPGVDPDKLPSIFERYVSFREAPKPAETGAPAAQRHEGLGLWIVKRNVEGLGGTVTARNRKGGGFEICVSLRIQA